MRRRPGAGACPGRGPRPCRRCRWRGPRRRGGRRARWWALLTLSGGRFDRRRWGDRRPGETRQCHDGSVTTPTKAPAGAAPPVGAARRETADAIVIGGGPNGLVAAITLADAGWDVVLLEARDKVGGAVSSVERDGWVMDEFSACYPLAVASPVMSRLGLEDHGLEWCRSD